MDNYTISYSRKEKLAQEESMLDTNVEKTKVIESFNGVTLKQSLKELDDFISNGTIRDRVATNFVLYFITVVGIFLIITLLDTTIATLLAMYAFNKPFDSSMCLALFALLSIPSMIASISIHDKLFPRQNRFDRLKKKTLGTGYEILKDIVDCPITTKQELYSLLDEKNKYYLTLKDGNLFLYNKDFDYELQVTGTVKNDETQYLINQLEEGKFYSITDIITDKQVKYEKGN